jgi:hypothetical protein
MKPIRHLLAGAAALALAAQAAAVPVTISVVGADFNDVVGGTNVNFTNSDGIAGNEEVRWGTPAEGGQSGYRFDSAAPPAFVVETGTQFSLGDFTHFNFPIVAGTSISGLSLDIMADLEVEGNPVSEGPFVFSFLHNETTNGCSPLPTCANDIVSFSNLVSSDSFNVNGVDYTLTLLGFMQGGVFTEFFSTIENQANTAQLIASFTAVLPPVTVPEPGTLLLFGAALAGLGMARRRQA